MVIATLYKKEINASGTAARVNGPPAALTDSGLCHWENRPMGDWVGHLTNETYSLAWNMFVKSLPNPAWLFLANVVSHMGFFFVTILQGWVYKTHQTQQTCEQSDAFFVTILCSPTEDFGTSKICGRDILWTLFITFGPNTVVLSMKSAYKRSYPTCFRRSNTSHVENMSAMFAGTVGIQSATPRPTRRLGYEPCNGYEWNVFRCNRIQSASRHVDMGDVRRIDKMFRNAVSFDLSRAPQLYLERVKPEHLGGSVKSYYR